MVRIISYKHYRKCNYELWSVAKPILGEESGITFRDYQRNYRLYSVIKPTLSEAERIGFAKKNGIIGRRPSRRMVEYSWRDLDKGWDRYDDFHTDNYELKQILRQMKKQGKTITPEEMNEFLVKLNKLPDWELEVFFKSFLKKFLEIFELAHSLHIGGVSRIKAVLTGGNSHEFFSRQTYF